MIPSIHAASVAPFLFGTVNVPYRAAAKEEKRDKYRDREKTRIETKI